MKEHIDTIIVCGGKGSRIGKLAEKHRCKSLIPILGIPAISYLTHAIREAVPDSKIILAVDSLELKNRFETVYKTQGVIDYHIYEGLPRGPVQAFYEAGSLCRSKKVLIFIGNQLVSSDHIIKLLSHEDDELVLSAFSLLSEDNCKIAKIDDNSRILEVARYSHLESLNNKEVYIDVPYLVPNNFFSMETFPEIKRLFVKAPMRKTRLIGESKIVAEVSDFPPEFHFKEELRSLEACVSRHFSDFIKQFRGKFNE